MMTVSRTIGPMFALAAFAGNAAAAEPSSYAAYADRPVKALSAERMAQLRDGGGLGYALAAELNGYPGPRHVLDFGGPLGLTPEQRASVEALFRDMQAEARPLGAEIIEREAALDRAFADKAVTAERLAEATAGIAAVEGRLRAVHLRYHLDTRALLSPEQLVAYGRLRGYAAAGGQDGGASKHHGAGHAH